MRDAVLLLSFRVAASKVQLGLSDLRKKHTRFRRTLSFLKGRQNKTERKNRGKWAGRARIDRPDRFSE